MNGNGTESPTQWEPPPPVAPAPRMGRRSAGGARMTPERAELERANAELLRRRAEQRPPTWSAEVRKAIPAAERQTEAHQRREATRDSPAGDPAPARARNAADRAALDPDRTAPVSPAPTQPAEDTPPAPRGRSRTAPRAARA